MLLQYENPDLTSTITRFGLGGRRPQFPTKLRPQPLAHPAPSPTPNSITRRPSSCRPNPPPNLLHNQPAPLPHKPSPHNHLMSVLIKLAINNINPTVAHPRRRLLLRRRLRLF